MSIHPVLHNWGWLEMIRLARRLRMKQVDVVNLQYVPHMYSRFGLKPSVAALPALLRILARKPTLTTCHELLGHKLFTLKEWLLQAAYLFQAWLICSGSRWVVVPTCWQERQLKRRFPWLAGKIRRIPVGNNISVVAEGKPRAHGGAPAVEPNSVVLGMFGVGHPWCQYEMGLKILKGLLEKGIRARLLCIGDIASSNPEYYNQLRKMEAALGLSGSVRWTGWLPPDEVSRHLQSVDIFLALHSAGVTARNTTLVTALAHRLPIVATRGPDADDWLISSGAMSIMDPHNPSEGIGAVMRLAKDASARSELGQRALAFYEKHFSWETISGQLLDVISHPP